MKKLKDIVNLHVIQYVPHILPSTRRTTSLLASNVFEYIF